MGINWSPRRSVSAILVTVSERVARFASKTGHELYPFIQLLSAWSIESDTSLCRISMTLVMIMSMMHLAVAKRVGSPHVFQENMIDFPAISIFKG
jgi:hypothetical protein